MPRARTIYDTPEWQRVRKMVLARDRHTCMLRCSKKCRGVATCVDHIVRPEDGGPIYEPTNLQGSCIACNSAKGQRLMAARARRVSPRLQSW